MGGRYDPETALVTTTSSSTGTWKKMLSGRFNTSKAEDHTLEISDRTNATNPLSDTGSDYGDEEYSKVANEKAKLLAERLDVAQQLADAIAYLHSQNVLHRDLKPDNIGFDIHGDLKVFDFDIARVCPTSDSSNPSTSNKRLGSGNSNENETFLMTQKVGSPRYMSPEVANRAPYNMKADVYSYAVLTHQILTLQKPYDDISDESHDELVFRKGVRPFLPVGLPIHTKDILRKAWSHTISDRPNMEVIRQVMALERSELLRVGTIGQSLAALPVDQCTAYVWSCSFEAISDNSKKLKKIKSKNTGPMVRRESFKNSKKKVLLSLFRKSLDKPNKKILLKETVSTRAVQDGTSWIRR